MPTYERGIMTVRARPNLGAGGSGSGEPIRAGSVTFDTPGDVSITWPAGVSVALLECWGGGGGGVGLTAATGPQHGAGGGAYSAQIVVGAPLTVYAGHVGVGGTGGTTNNQTDGADTTFAASVVVARGGQSGALHSGSNRGRGGQASAGTGTTKTNGGNGSGTTTAGGGGGGSGGSGGAGGNGLSDGTAGAAGVGTSPGAVGGTGGAGAGGAGGTPGGGGAGGNAAAAGGAGGHGRIRITWPPPA